MAIGNLIRNDELVVCRLNNLNGFFMKEVKKVILCLFQNGYTELEWLMPILYSYKLRNVNVSVLLPERARNPRQKLMLEWVNTYSDNILYGSDILANNWLLKIRNYFLLDNKSLFAKIARMLFNKIFVRMKVVKIMLQYFNYFSTSEARRILDTFDIIYCPEGAFPRPMPEGLAKLVFLSVKMLKKPMVGYLKSAYSDIRDLTRRNNGLDFLLVLSETDKEVCEQAGIRALVLGAYRFNNSWILEISKYFAETQESNNLKRLLKNKPISLVLLKNRTGLIQNAISYGEHLEYRKRIFLSLVNAGFHLLIKPHPAENSLPLEEALEIIPKDSYTISEIPAQYLASISSCTVCEMPSNSLMDSIAAGKKSYWPSRVLSKGDERLTNEEMVNIYFEGGFPKNFIQFVEMDLPEKNSDFVLSNEMREQFDSLVNSHIDINNVISMCERQVLQGMVD